MTLMKSLRSRVKQEEDKRNKKALLDEDDGDDVISLDGEEQARAREEKIKKASQPKYHWTKFPNIRDGDNFAKGVLLNKKKVKTLQLKWQDSVIGRSLYDFDNMGDKTLDKLAVRIHKALLGACLPCVRLAYLLGGMCVSLSLTLPAPVSMYVLHVGVCMCVLSRSLCMPVGSRVCVCSPHVCAQVTLATAPCPSPLRWRRTFCRRAWRPPRLWTRSTCRSAST